MPCEHSYKMDRHYELNVFNNRVASCLRQNVKTYIRRTSLHFIRKTVLDKLINCRILFFLVCFELLNNILSTTTRYNVNCLRGEKENHFVIIKHKLGVQSFVLCAQSMAVVSAANKVSYLWFGHFIRVTCSLHPLRTPLLPVVFPSLEFPVFFVYFGVFRRVLFA